VNIRGCQPGVNKKGESYLLVRLEDESGAPYELIDKDMERQQHYKRNTDMDLTLDISVRGKYTTLRIIDAKVIDN